MIASISGTLQGQGKDYVIIETQGIGFEVFVSSKTAGTLPLTGQPVKLLTWLLVKEDALTLFGFAAPEEKEMFLKLTGVTGVGPKVAMAILSGMSVNELTLAILSEDARAISRTPGVGKKIAERVILELKEKVDAVGGAAAASGGELLPKAAEGDNTQEAVRALMALGYTSAEASTAVRKAGNKTGTVEEIIMAALRGLDSGR